MKKSIITLAIIAAALTSCASSRSLAAAEIERASWAAFCRAFGYDTADRDNEQAVNEYLDAWCGSVAEEEALAKIGVEL